MDNSFFDKRLETLNAQYESLINQKNEIDPGWNNGLYDRYRYPVLTAAHAPLFWRYDLNPKTNPYLMERMGINAVFNPGAMEFNGKVCLMCRVEGY